MALAVRLSGGEVVSWFRRKDVPPAAEIPRSYAACSVRNGPDGTMEISGYSVEDYKAITNHMFHLGQGLEAPLDPALTFPEDLPRRPHP